MSQEDNKEKSSTLLTEYEWLIRPCEMYKDEYDECTSIKGRFHQYFIYGESLDCAQWKRDLDNCTKWKDNKDIKAVDLLLKSELERRHARLNAHYSNDIWEKRPAPPEDWNKELPDYIAKEYENSYLWHKSREMKGEVNSVNSLSERTLCAIM